MAGRYDNTYKDFTYVINKCDITHVFYLLLWIKSFINNICWMYCDFK